MKYLYIRGFDEMRQTTTPPDEAQYREVAYQDMEVLRFNVEKNWFERLIVTEKEEKEPDDWDAEENGDFEGETVWEIDWEFV